MEYAYLGRTGLQVSRLCLGTMNFGPETTEDDSHAIMDKALEDGINFFDTADVYGWKQGEGWTEQIIGRWLAQGGGRREGIVLATKVYNPMGDGVNEKGLSAFHIRAACEASLRRLRTDHIDLYQMHHIQRDTPIEEILQAMELLVKQGKVLYVGSSNVPAWYIAKFNMVSASRNFFGLVSEQCHYNLSMRYPELEVLPAAREFGMGVIPWSPLRSGILAGILGKLDKGRRASEGVQKTLNQLRPRVEKWEAFCGELGEKPADVALAWLLHNPAVAAPIIGPRTIEQLVGCQRAVELKLDEAALAKMDEIWPTPWPNKASHAPEAYSW